MKKRKYLFCDEQVLMEQLSTCSPGEQVREPELMKPRCKALGQMWPINESVADGLSEKKGADGDDAKSLFVSKLLESFARGYVTAAVLLMNARGADTNWFHALLWYGPNRCKGSI